jgi:hypothetical protein
MPNKLPLAAALVCVAALQAGAQGAGAPRGYNVRGWYGGTEGPPWTAELTVGDTVIEKVSHRMVRYVSRYDGTRWLFNYVALWAPDGSVSAHWWGNGGGGPMACDVTASATEAIGRSHSNERLTARAVGAAPVPEFALAGWLSRQTLAQGDTIRATVLRCLPHRETEAIEMNNFVGVVASRTFALNEGTAEDAWVIEGRPEYRAKVVIAKRDGTVLEVLTPQGSVGHSIDRLRSR